MLVNSIQVQLLEALHKKRPVAPPSMCEMSFNKRQRWPILVNLTLNQSDRLNDSRLEIDLSCSCSLRTRLTQELQLADEIDICASKCEQQTRAKLSGLPQRCCSSSEATITTTTSDHLIADDVDEVAQQPDSTSMSLAAIGATLRRISDEFEQCRTQRRRRRTTINCINRTRHRHFE